MTAFEVAGTFASIVGLIANYKQDKENADGKAHRDFLEWLEYHRHEEVKNLICNNAALLMEVNQLLRADTQTVLHKIDQMSNTLATLASSFQEFRGIANAVTRADQVHPETMEVLRNLVQNDWRKFGIIHSRGQPQPLTIEGRCGAIDCEIRYFEEDLERLVEFGFLRCERNRGGEAVFSLTRSAEKFIGAGTTNPSGSSPAT